MAVATHTPPPLPPLFTNTSPPPILLFQGAEAHLYKTTFLTPETPAALKVRPTKPYRHDALDRRLTRQRVLHEARCLLKLVREGVRVPALLSVDWEPSGGQNQQRLTGAWMLMEWIDGPAVRVVVERWEVWMKKSLGDSSQEDKTAFKEAEENRVKDLMKRIGQAVGSMHKAGVVHGDLTTSNLILRPLHTVPGQALEQSFDRDKQMEVNESPSMEGEIVLIDFGLASSSVQEEDRAVDLYVLERAFGSTHPMTEGFFDHVLQGYSDSFKGTQSVLRKLEDVRMRGRKRSMLG
ncbi:kinase-like domain-containing protein [Talaromyces proteolyticus]|uniref:EKC/KEOPS complex subunit BUD32 n=1 Tax=Talaromyces proteolyticus TaxID=1131652 RepID=A0AAD4KMH9_9EURO|nr:kinase-like domain-containing protein [Talaromyces proteolyticus]KAH8692620.1 kinase-like domain-containing protein [Talaromyces proteolyticus]